MYKKNVDKTKQSPTRSFWLASGMVLLFFALVFITFNAFEDSQRMPGLTLVAITALIGVIVSIFSIIHNKSLTIRIVLCLWLVMFLQGIFMAGTAILLGGGSLDISF